MTVIFDSSNGQELRINTIGSWLRREFGKKVIKLSIDAGFTCPNRDGSKGNGGCLFCSDSGSGDHASSIDHSLMDPQNTDHNASRDTDHTAIRDNDHTVSRDIDAVRSALGAQVRLLSSKWPRAAYIAYFQSNTNTYGPVSELRSLYEAALAQPGIVGIAIATRPDCLSPDVLDLLEELNGRTFLWVELGLQTIHERTMEDMNLCYDLADYDRAVAELHGRGIPIVTHLLLGLPGEDREMMLDSVRYVCRPVEEICDQPVGRTQAGTDGLTSQRTGRYIFGLKLHMLNVVSDSALPERYPDHVPFASIDEYTDLIVDALEIIPPEITIHRIYADAPKETLIAPTWARRKRLVLNDIHNKLRDRDTWHGHRVE